MSEVRTTVLGIVSRDDEYLVQRLVEPGEGAFYRPIGGGIEFGETSAEALEREFREELDASVAVGPTVGTLENRFTWDGTPEHELVVLRAAEFIDDSLYGEETFAGVDKGGAVEYEATWRGLDELVEGDEPLYPDGLERLLRGAGSGNGHVADP